MKRLLIHVEGVTEETFVRDVITPHLLRNCGYGRVDALLLGDARRKSGRGGIRAWDSARRGIVRCLRQDPAGAVSTMVDYYGMPASGPHAWPGRAESAGLSHSQKASSICSALAASVAAEMPRDFNPSRFIPYVVMHEFEGLLFSDCERFAAALGRPDLAPVFSSIRGRFATPEEINDSRETAPSKRIAACLAYKKVVHGPKAASAIGVDRIRAACPGFAAWISALEAWPGGR